VNLDLETTVKKHFSMNKKTQKQIKEELDRELRKQGINPDMIGEYGDIDFEEGIDDYTYISKINDNWDEYGDNDY
jgi:hypothetical protein